MWLFPTKEEINRLSRSINPTAQIFDYALYMTRYPTEGSMAEFFLESQEYDAIEDDYCDNSNPFLENWEDTGIMHGAQLTNWDEI